MSAKTAMRSCVFLEASLAAAMTCQPAGSGQRGRFRSPEARLRFEISFTRRRAEPLDGRSCSCSPPKRRASPVFRSGMTPASQQVFGIDVDGLQPGRPAFIDGACSAIREKHWPNPRR